MTFVSIRFPEFISNQAIAISELFSNVSSIDFKFESQTYEVVSSAKLHRSTPFNAKTISLM